MMLRSPTHVWVVAAVLALAACGSPPRVEAPAPPTPPPAPAPARDLDAERRAAEEAARRAEAERMRATIAERVFFDYDKFDIRADQQPVMEAKIAALRANPEVRLTIEGHADERGSIEYNLALGMRRANAARDFFTVSGLDGARFEVVSFGEERPLNPGQNESAWAQNRRAEFVIR